MNYTTLEIIGFIVLVIIAAVLVIWMIRYDEKYDEMNACTRYDQAHKTARQMRDDDHVDRSFMG